MDLDLDLDMYNIIYYVIVIYFLSLTILAIKNFFMSRESNLMAELDCKNILHAIILILAVGRIFPPPKKIYIAKDSMGLTNKIWNLG